MHAKKLLSLLLSALAAVTLLASCGSRWDYSREAVKAANEAQGETLRVEFQVDQKFTNALHDAVEENIQPADVEKAMLADASLKELLTSGYRLNVYALRADVDAEEAARTIAEEQILPRLSGCKDEGVISMVKADNNYFYEAVLTYKESSSGGGGGGHEPGKPDDEPEKPVNKYTVTVVILPEGEDLGTVTPSATEVEEGGEVTFTVEPNDDVTVVSIAAQVGEAASFTYEYVEGTKYTINDIHGNVTITVEFKSEPPVFPVEWNATTGTLTFQVGSDGTTAAAAMNSEILTNAVRNGLEQQAAWLTEHDFESFDASTFDLKEQVQHLVIKSGSGVTAIGSHAFCGGSYGVFDPEGNTMLQSVQLSPEVKDIYQQAFYNCRNLATIDMPGVETIGFSSFSGCSSLANVTLTGTTSIGSTAFESCTALTKLSINSSGKDLEISMGGFSTCTSLQEVQISANKITLKGGYNTGLGISIPSGVFTQCTNLKTVKLNGHLEEVGECAFALLKNPVSLDFEVEPNSEVTIYCTDGLDAFKAACDDHTLEDIGIAGENQIQSIN